MDEPIRILLCEDEENLGTILQELLQSKKFAVTLCTDGDQGWEAFKSAKYDLCLLDIMMPKRDGLTLAKDIRSLSADVPIIVLTALGLRATVLEGFRSGADDYITKPFKPKELIARIRARLRRTDDEPAEVYEIGDLTIDVPQHTVTRGGEEIQLTPLEFDLLLEMAQKPNQVHTREELLESVWGYRNASDTRLVNVHVQRLRSKIEHDPENPEIILTVRGVGYKTGKPEV